MGSEPVKGCTSQYLDVTCNSTFGHTQVVDEEGGLWDHGAHWNDNAVIPTPAEDTVIRPSHYGGADNPYEAIKVIEAWGLNFSLGNTVKYISRAGKKDSRIADLKKARQYLDFEIARIESE